MTYYTKNTHHAQPGVQHFRSSSFDILQKDKGTPVPVWWSSSGSALGWRMASKPPWKPHRFFRFRHKTLLTLRRAICSGHQNFCRHLYKFRTCATIKEYSTPSFRRVRGAHEGAFVQGPQGGFHAASLAPVTCSGTALSKRSPSSSPSLPQTYPSFTGWRTCTPTAPEAPCGTASDTQKTVLHAQGDHHAIFPEVSEFD